MQGEALEGRALKLEMSSGRKTDDDAGGGSGGSEKVPKGFSATKIVVRNVAFEATKRDVQKLFNPFGALKSCRLPKKFDGNHRGFAFVELSTKREASAALEALRGTHLYGRRLTIERAAEDDDVAAIREKTAARFGRGGCRSARRRRGRSRLQAKKAKLTPTRVESSVETSRTERDGIAYGVYKAA